MKNRTYSEVYQQLASKASHMGEENDCTVKALALATGISYEEAHADLAARGRVKGEGFNNLALRIAITERDMDLVRVDPYSIIDQYPGRHSTKLYITTHHPARFPQVWQNGKKYLMFTSGHVLVIDNGVTLDWSIKNSLRCFDLYEIVKA